MRPVYNTEKYIRENVESILNQSYRNLEIIYVCDGCTDDTYNILKNYSDDRIRLIHNIKNHGAANSRNQGLDIANGSWIIFWDADDIVEITAIETMLKSAKENDSDAVICRIDTLDGDYKKRQDYFFQSLKLKYNSYPCIENRNENVFEINNGNEPFTKLLKRELIMKNCIYFQDIPNCNDVFFSYACIRAAKRISYVDEVLYWYRDKAENNISSKRVSEKTYILEALDKIYELGKNDTNFKKNFQEFVKTEILAYRGYKVYSQLLDSYYGYYKIRWDIGLDVEKERIYSFRGREKVKGKRIVIFGAGQVGKDYYHELKEQSVIIAWIDNNWKKYNNPLIQPVESIKNISYDFIILAVNSENFARQMRIQLQKLDITNNIL